MVDPTYLQKNYTMLNNVAKLPVPDGYHKGENLGAGNEGWLYIVPNSVSLSSNHIDAKPFSFAMTVSSAANLDFDAENANSFMKMLVLGGALQLFTRTETLILSSHSAFFYQCWSNENDPTYLKLNGVLATGSAIYQFHIFANYDSPVALQMDTQHKFMDIALSWMSNVSVVGERPYVRPKIDAVKSDVVACADKIGNLVQEQTPLLGITMDYPEELKQYFLTIGAMFCQHYNITAGSSTMDAVREMLGAISHRTISASDIQTALSRCPDTIYEYLQSYEATAVIKQLVKLDKMANVHADEGLTYMLYSLIDDFLQILCVRHSLFYAQSAFYRQCMCGLKLLIADAWKATDVRIFTPGGNASSSGSLSSFGSTNFSGGGNGTVIEYPRCRVIPKTQCEIDYFDTLTSFSGNGKNIAIPDNVTAIGTDAFCNADIKTVVVPEGVTEIESDAFWNCKKLEHIVLPSSLSRIGNNAFRGCGFSYVIIPEGVRYIGDDVFTSCSNLKDIYLPYSVREIGDDAFCTFNNDTVIHAPAGSNAEEYAQEHGIAFDNNRPPLQIMEPPKQKTAKPAEPKETKKPTQDFGADFSVTAAGTLQKYKGIDKKVTVPNGVKKIGAKAFNGNMFTQEVIIPDGVTHIGKEAFSSCWELKRVVLSKTIKVIEDSAFAYARKLESVDLPEGLSEIKFNTFSSCDKLKSIVIPASVKKIDGFAFSSCEALEEIIVSDSVQDISQLAFRDSPKLVIKCRPGSYAQRFAIKENIPFKDSRTAEEIAAEKAEMLGKAKQLEAIRKKWKPAQQLIGVALDHTVGLKTDGSVITTPKRGTIDTDEGQRKVSQWKNITAVYAGGRKTVGITDDGKVLYAGETRNEEQIIANRWRDIVSLSAGYSLTVGLLANGTAVAVGYNGNGQRNVLPWSDLVAVKAGFNHTVGLKKDGTAVAIGYNDDGRCNVKGWTDIVELDAGDGFTVGLKVDGTVVSTGSNSFGKCNVFDWKDIVSVSAGDHHTVGLRSNGTVCAVGNNDSGQCNVSGWRDIVAVFAGNSHTVGIKSNGIVISTTYTGDIYKGQCEVGGWRLFTNIDTLEAEQEVVRQRREEEKRRLAEEAERRRKAAEEAERKRLQLLAERRAAYDDLRSKISEQEKIIAENKGWFGAQAKVRKEAKVQLESLQTQMRREFPSGRP